MCKYIITSHCTSILYTIIATKQSISCTGILICSIYHKSFSFQANLKITFIFFKRKKNRIVRALIHLLPAIWFGGLQEAALPGLVSFWKCAKILYWSNGLAMTSHPPKLTRALYKLSQKGLTLIIALARIAGSEFFL